MADSGRLEKRISDIFSGLPPDFSEYCGYANWNRDHALRLGPLSDRYELHVHAYAKATQLVRHHYFRETEWQRQISFYDAIDLFGDSGYEIGFNDHWMTGLRRNLKTFKKILHAPSIEAVHAVIGDYVPLSREGKPMGIQIPMPDVRTKTRAA